MYAEEFVGEGIRVLNKVLAILKEKEDPDLQKLIQNSQTIKDELVEFNHKVPLLVALKKNGMAKRHWKEISEKTRIEIDPETQPGFNFQYILDKGLLQHKNLCIEIGEKALKEYNIE